MKKTFDAVNFQRKARAELSKQYLEDRKAFLKELAERYGKPRKIKGRRTLQTTATQRHSA